MRIQAKLFILLLVIGLIPLAALSWRSEQAMQSLGRAIAGAGKTAAVSEMQTQLLQAVATSSDLMEAQRRQVELALRLLAREVENRLAGAPPVGDIPLYFHTDFDSSKTWPPGAELAIDHAIASATGELQAIPISRAHQSFLIPPGVEPGAVRPLMRRLAGMDDLYRRLERDNPGLFYWQYITLEDGVHTSFPGHGGYPPAYDPRQREWYANTRNAEDVVWNPPLLDASTRRLLLTATMPIRGDENAFAGVAAIDVDVLSFLDSAHARARLGSGAESYIVQLIDAEGHAYVQGKSAGTPSLRVIASSLYRDTGIAWDARPETPALEADKSIIGRITADLAVGRDGIQRGVHRGREALWVYGGLENLGSTLLYIVPVDDIEVVAEKAQDNVRQAVLDEVRLAGIASIALVVMIAGLAALAARTITGPLRELAATAEGLARGNLEARADVGSRDEVGDLAMVFNAMVPELRSHIQVKESLTLAREVQQKLLPEAAPRIAGFDIAGRSVYHDAVGGDYYDFIPLRGDGGRERLGLVVGDVSGHGIVAALTMTSVRALLRSFAKEDTALQPVMRAVNRHVAADSAAGRFVTLVYLVLEPETRRLRWISAGHGPLLFFDRATREFEELAAQDIPLGVNPDWLFHENDRSDWPAGGMLILGTDGIWETRNPAGDAFGKEGLMDVIRANSHLPAAQICDAVVDALTAFSGGIVQNDDVTLVVVKFPETAV
ncbi:MAG: SpoIIE family protein phosphatase [Proteobacteria bacterium]|nr:SpoIIE family protein phosphatase [Pseudomonadota bacterium]